MSLHILRSYSQLPDPLENAAVVNPIKKNGLKKLFGPRTGTVTLSQNRDSGYSGIQVIPPVWKGGKKEEREALRQCYVSVLRTALQHRFRVIALPLLAREDPAFPSHIDFATAVETIQAFLKSHPMEVLLIVARQNAARMPELHRDLDSFLDWNLEGPALGPEPFALSDDRFTNLAPAPEPDYLTEASIQSALDALEEEASGEPCAWVDSECYPSPMRADEDEDLLWEAEEEAAQPRRKRAAYIPSPRKQAMPKASASRSVSRDTGTLPGKMELGDLLDNLDAGFSETLLTLIDKTGRKDSEIYNKANVSRQHFSKIRNNPNYKPSKATAIAFAIALELDLEQTLDLIGRAGYTLTRSSKFDLIILYFIRQRNYDMFDINETLYEYDQSLLGA